MELSAGTFANQEDKGEGSVTKGFGHPAQLFAWGIIFNLFYYIPFFLTLGWISGLYIFIDFQHAIVLNHYKATQLFFSTSNITLPRITLIFQLRTRAHQFTTQRLDVDRCSLVTIMLPLNTRRTSDNQKCSYPYDTGIVIIYGNDQKLST